MVNGLKTGEKTEHPCQIPLKVMHRIIKITEGDTILDPFGGSGTTGQVAIELARKAVLIELNPQYVSLIEKRTDVTPGLVGI